MILNLSEVLMRHPELEDFATLLAVIREERKGAMFFRIDVKPQFADTPVDWEDRLEAAFT